MKKMNFILLIFGAVLLIAPFAAQAQDIDFLLDPRLYYVEKTGPERVTFGKAPYIVKENKPSIYSSKAVFCTDEYCDFKFAIFVSRQPANDAFSLPIVISTINDKKNFIQQNLKVEFVKGSNQTHLVFKGRLFFGGMNNIKIGIDPLDKTKESDETNNFYDFYYTLVKD